MHLPSIVVSADDAGWTLACRSNGGRRRRRVFSAATTSKCVPTVDRRNLADATMGNNNDDDKEVQAAVMSQLTIRMERFKHRMPPKFFHTILSFIGRVLRSRPLALIRAFGMGCIETSISSAYQFFLLETIKDHFGVPLATSQDPVTTLADKCYLEGRGITVLPSDDLKSAPPVEVRLSEFTLLYMLHCTAEMYDNVLSYYSHTDRLHNLILIGNDPSHSIGTSSATISFDDKPYNYANDCHHPRQLQSSGSIPFPHLAKFSLNSVSFQLPHFEPSEIAFAFTYISFWNVYTNVAENENFEKDSLSNLIS